MDNATFQKIKEIILKHQEIAVIVGSNPNLDTMAAGLGLYLVLKQMGKNIAIASPTAPIVAVSSLVGIDKVQNTIGTQNATGDLTVSFPYKEGEIDKVSYTLDNGMLNILVKAGEKGLSFDQKDIMYKRNSTMPTLVFLIGVSQLFQVAAIFTPQPGVEIVNIDNKAENEKYGDIAVVDPRWSSVSEQVADFVTLLEPQVELDRDTAQNLLDGIDFATQDFRSAKTSYLAFEVAGILMKKGAVRDVAKKTSQNSLGANTIANNTQFFPPVPVREEIQQPQVVAPIAPVVPQPQVQPTAWQPPVYQQPQVQPTVSEPVVGASNSMQTPPDWLTPKVYKGSSIL